MKPQKHSRLYSPSKASIWLRCYLSTVFNDGSSDEKISDEKMLMVILYRDVSFKSYEDISKAVNLSLSYVYKLHKMGIDELNKT